MSPHTAPADAVIAFFSAWQVFMDTENFDTATFVTSASAHGHAHPDYLPAVLVPGAYVVRKLYAKTKIIPLMEVDRAYPPGCAHPSDYRRPHQGRRGGGARRGAQGHCGTHPPLPLLISGL